MPALALTPLGGAALPVLASFASVVWGFLAVALVIVSLLLIAIILIQDPKGGGLTSAFGAGPGGESLLGARAQRDVTIWTSWLTLAFLVIALILVLFDPASKESAGAVGAGPAIGGTPAEDADAVMPPGAPGLPGGAGDADGVAPDAGAPGPLEDGDTDPGLAPTPPAEEKGSGGAGEDG